MASLTLDKLSKNSESLVSQLCVLAVKIPRGFSNLWNMEDQNFKSSKLWTKPERFGRFSRSSGNILDFGMFGNSLLRGTEDSVVGIQDSELVD